VVIGGWDETNGQFRSLLVGVYKGTHLIYVGKVGTGFGEQVTRTLLSRLKSYVSDVSPFGGVNAPKKGKEFHWIRPELVAEVEFAGWTSDGLVRQALQECWSSLPEDMRTYEAWRDRAEKTFIRNRKVWSAIKKPTPAAFFDNLAPYPSDGHFRQAMVLGWMMMPRAGGRDFKDVIKAMDAIFRRNMDAWAADNRTFTTKTAKTSSGTKKKIATKKKTTRKRR
jgi:hypothetical protein